MKVFYKKSPAVLFFSFLVTGIVLLSCGQADTKTETMSEPPKMEAITDSQVNTAMDTMVLADNTTLTVKTDPAPLDKKNEPVPVIKPTKEQPVVTVTKPAPVTKVTPVAEKPVPPPPPPVKTEVKVAEPVKPPVQASPPKTPEQPKPVTVTPSQPAQDSWIVPAKYKNMTNPYPPDNASISMGKTLYGKHCQSCHGSKGDGKGPKAAQLDTEMRSFLSAGFLAEKPGEVFYKTVFGRKDMPKYEKKIPDEEEQWAVVNYIMSLK